MNGLNDTLPALGAKQRLGARFDIRAFHDEILSVGSLPIDLLEARVAKWIGRQLPNSTAE